MPEVRIGEVTPPADVLDYFRAKQLSPRFSWLDVFGQEHAHAFTVAKAVEADVLAAFRATIDQAIAKGLTYEEWRAELEPRLRALGWWGPRTVADPETGETRRVDFSSPRRLENIFWSNVRAARAAGQWERAQETKDVLPYLLYVETTAAEPRAEHLGWVGTILPVGHPWWDTHFPPNGWGCKCSVRQVGRVEAKRLGGVSPDPEVETVAFRNRRTGEVIEVPAGIDPGWHSNPGKSRAAGLSRVLADKIGRIPDDELRRRAIARVMESDDFGRLLAGRGPKKTGLPVGELPPAAVPERAATPVVLLSAETATKQARHHPEITEHVYAQLPAFIARAEPIFEGDNTVHLVGEIDGQPWHAVVKRTQGGDGLYLTSFHRTTARHIARLRRRTSAMQL